MNLPTTTDLSLLVVKDEQVVKFFKTANVFKDELEAYPEEIAKNYEYEETSRTYYLPEYIWLKWREHGPYYYDPSHPQYIPVTIGGSDVSVLFDGSRLSKMLYLYNGQHGSEYKAAIELFYEKLGIEFDLKERRNPDIFETGHIEEDSIRVRFQKKFQKDHPHAIVQVINDCHLYQCGRRDADGNLELPFVLCNLDGLVKIDGTAGILECKTCTFNSADFHLWKQNIVPLKYYLQLCWYMLCMNMPYAYICCKWGLTERDMTYIYVERNFEVENELISIAKEFVDCVMNKSEPKISGQNLNRLNIFWRKKMGRFEPAAPTAKLSEDMSSVICQIDRINQQIEVREKEIEKLKKSRNELLIHNVYPEFGKSNFGFIQMQDGRKATVKLKSNTKIPEVLDEEGLKRDHPDIYKKYLEKHMVFNKTLFKKEQKILAEQYISKSTELTDARQNYCKITFAG